MRKNWVDLQASVDNYQLTKKQLEELELLVARTREIKELDIIESQLPMDVVYAPFFEPEDLVVLTQTARDNYIKVPIYDDRDFHPDGYMNIYGTKLLDYNLKKEPLGFRRISIISGNRIIKEQFSRESFDKITSTNYTFFFDEEKEHYLEYSDPRFATGNKKPKHKKNKKGEEEEEDGGATNSDLAKERMDEIKMVLRTYQPFILDYLNKKKTFFGRKENDFVRYFNDLSRIRDMGSGKNYGFYWHLMNEFVKFLENSKIYFSCMYVLAFITTEEYDILNKRVDLLNHYIKKAFETLENKRNIFNQSGGTKSFEFGLEKDDIWMNKTEDEEMGPVQKSIDQLRKLLMYRPETASDVKLQLKNGEKILTGYIFDKETEHLYPNFTEIERRKNLHITSVMKRDEEELQRWIENIVKKWKSKKQEL
jgi:hypothetical protein